MEQSRDEILPNVDTGVTDKLNAQYGELNFALTARRVCVVLLSLTEQRK